MVIQHDNLRMMRRQARLNQADIAYLMQLTDYSIISRWEQGQRKPGTDALTVYHLLFDIPIKPLMEDQLREIRAMLVTQIKLLLDELRKQRQSQKIRGKEVFLESILTRLTANL
jgi:transcriptional regulator with XRE-family HTH domain